MVSEYILKGQFDSLIGGMFFSWGIWRDIKVEGDSKSDRFYSRPSFIEADSKRWCQAKV